MDARWQGKPVAVVERKWIGGSCPNIACLPSKNVIHSATIASLFRRSAEFGMETSGFTVDMRKVRERKRAMVRGLVNLHLENFRKSGAELVLSSGQFVGPRTLGGGSIGLEMAQAMRRFGSRVSVIERDGRLLLREDEDVAEGMRALFEDESIDLVLGPRSRASPASQAMRCG